jgi:hypothetical protein
MTLEMIKRILQNKLQNLNGQKSDMIAVGNLEAIAKLDAEILETQTTLDQLAGL